MRVLNKRYWKSQITVDKIVKHMTDVDPRETWCRQNIKKGYWYSHGWNPVIFSFKKSEDATLFKLMWS